MHLWLRLLLRQWLYSAMVHNLVLYDVDCREKQQRYFCTAAHHQWRIIHLHAVINPHAGRNDAQNAEQEGQAVCAFILIQQKHEYEAP